MRSILKGVVIAAIVLVSAPAVAHADGFITPFTGINFGNNSGDGRGNVGVSFGWMGAGIAGVEGDVAYAPNFFGSPGKFGGNNVVTGMANLIVGVPGGGTHGKGVRPFGTLGVGLIRTKVNGAPEPNFFPAIDDNTFGVSGGLGLIGFMSEHVGLRGDVRYFRNFKDAGGNTVQFGEFHFWRAAVGVVIRP